MAKKIHTWEMKKPIKIISERLSSQKSKMMKKIKRFGHYMT